LGLASCALDEYALATNYFAGILADLDRRFVNNEPLIFPIRIISAIAPENIILRLPGKNNCYGANKKAKLICPINNSLNYSPYILNLFTSYA